MIDRKQLLLLIFVFIFGLACGAIGYFVLTSFLLPATLILPIFSPDEGHIIINQIDQAEKTIDIETYVFSSKEVIEALERAQQRGVEIRIVLEKRDSGGGNEKIFSELAGKGFNVRYASVKYRLTHAKVMIIDSKKIIVGSHNLTYSALNKNREASVVISDLVTVLRFIAEFEKDWRLAGD